jgi:hypothetical protein
MPPQARLMVLLGLLPVDLLDRCESSLPEPSPVMPGFCKGTWNQRAALS